MTSLFFGRDRIRLIDLLFFLFFNSHYLGVLCPYSHIMIKRSFTILLVLLPLLLMAQTRYVEDFDRLTFYETSDVDKQELSATLTEALVQDLQNPSFRIDSLAVQQLKSISSDDGVLKLYTWHYSLSDASSQYGGIVFYGGQFYPLSFVDRPIVATKSYTQDAWCGGIYYDIIPIQRKNTTIYTLLAWDGNNGVTSKKIIDVLSFDRKGKLIFGLPIFVNGRTSIYRAIIEYPASNSMLLEFDEEQKGIVSNALFANDMRYGDVSAYSSVSDDFNIHRYEEDKWVFYPNIDLRLNKKDSKALQSNDVRPSSGL